MKNDSPLANARPELAVYTDADRDDQVLTSPICASTVIGDDALQTHICSIWHAGHTWELWRMVAHVIGGAHDLYYAAGVDHGDPLLRDLEFLRELAETLRGMANETLAERVEDDALQDIAS